MTIIDISGVCKKLGATPSRINDHETAHLVEGRAFALTQEAAVSKLHLLCQPELAKILQADFESVQPSSKMDPRYWIEILLSGQLSDEQISSLIDLAYAQAIAQI